MFLGLISYTQSRVFLEKETLKNKKYYNLALDRYIHNEEPQMD